MLWQFFFSSIIDRQRSSFSHPPPFFYHCPWLADCSGVFLQQRVKECRLASNNVYKQLVPTCLASQEGTSPELVGGRNLDIMRSVVFGEGKGGSGLIGQKFFFVSLFLNKPKSFECSNGKRHALQWRQGRALQSWALAVFLVKTDCFQYKTQVPSSENSLL